MNTEEQASSQPSQAINRTDRGWKYCHSMEEGNTNTIVCNLCGKITKGWISRAKQHLMGKRGMLFELLNLMVMRLVSSLWYVIMRLMIFFINLVYSSWNMLLVFLVFYLFLKFFWYIVYTLFWFCLGCFCHRLKPHPPYLYGGVLAGHHNPPLITLLICVSIILKVMWMWNSEGYTEQYDTYFFMCFAYAMLGS